MKKITWLRLSYLIPAIADFAIAISTLIPARVGLFDFVYLMGMASAIAFSWGVLLIFAVRKPVERRWVLVPTGLVVTLLTTSRIYAEVMGLIESNPVYSIFGAALIILIVYSYQTTKGLTSNG